MERGTPILWDVVEEHLDEAAFLWHSWERALASPIFTLDLVASGPEERLLAHLDALVVGGEAVSRRLLEPALGGDDPGRAFAAAWTLLEAGEEKRVIGALQAADDAPRGGIRRAVELSGRPGIEAALLPVAGKGPAAAQAAALEALAFRGVDAGDALRAAAAVPGPAVRAAALRAARLSRAAWVPGMVQADLSSPDPAVREAAIETGLVLGLREAWSACARFAMAEPPSGRLMLLLALGGDAADQEPLLAAAAMPRPSREALFALGFAGRVAGADACLVAVGSEDPATARIAGEAFGAITGLVIAPPYQAVETEPEEPVPLEEERLDADLAAGPETDLPLPDAFGVESWWGRARPGFDPAVRYLGGKPRDAEAVSEALRGGPARRRHALALELEIRSKGALRLGTRRWARQQRPLPDGLRSIDLGRPFKALAKGV